MSKKFMGIELMEGIADVAFKIHGTWHRQPTIEAAKIFILDLYKKIRDRNRVVRKQNAKIIEKKRQAFHKALQAPTSENAALREVVRLMNKYN